MPARAERFQLFETLQLQEIDVARVLTHVLAREGEVSGRYVESGDAAKVWGKPPCKAPNAATELDAMATWRQ